MPKNYWTFAEFEERTKKERLTPKQKEKIHGFDVVWAEGYRLPKGRWNADEEALDEPHYLMMWAVGLDEKLDVGRLIYVSCYRKNYLGIEVKMDEADRKHIVMEDAREFIENNKKVKRY